MTSSQTLIFREEQNAFDATASESDIFNCFRLILGRYPGSVPSGLRTSSVWVSCFRTSCQFTLTQQNTKYSGLRVRTRAALNSTDTRFSLLQGILRLVADILEHRNYEPEVSSVFARKLRPGMHVLDIGANIGYYTFLAASIVGPSGKVWAIEPNSKNVAFLLATRARNGFGHIEIIQAAASDRWRGAFAGHRQLQRHGKTERWCGPCEFCKSCDGVASGWMLCLPMSLLT